MERRFEYMTELFNVSGKTALVTGGSKGIGLRMAWALGKAGANVVIASRNLKDLERAKNELQEDGVSCRYYSVDVTDKKQVEDVIQQVVDEFGSLDVLVNNAGMNIRKPLIEIEEHDWDQVQSTNIKGLFLVGQAAAKQMIKQRRGKIINISSILGKIGMRNQSSYAASKGGIDQLTKVWANELAEYGITVNAIAPAYIKTPMTEGWLSDPQRYEQIVDRTMLKRVGELSDLDGPILFLSSAASSYVTGQILYVDGGWTAN